ncbi:MAG: hypothetical protein AABX19_02470, partial [Nanoarchaeota archaeon]
MTEVKKIVNQLHPLERKLLPLLKFNNLQSEIAKNSKLEEVEITRAAQWLESKGLVTNELTITQIIKLTDHGKKYSEHGLPEKRFLKAIKNSILNLEDIKQKAELSNEEVNACIGLLRRNNYLETIKEKEAKFKITEQGLSILEKVSDEEQLLMKLKDSAK